MSRAARPAPLQFGSPDTAASLPKAGLHRAQPEISWVYVPRIQPGDYPGRSRFATVYADKQFKRWVCAVQFDILSNSLMEVVGRVTWYLNLGTRDKPHAGRRGNYYAAWIKANGGLPKRRDRLSPRVFEGRYARVRVGDTTKNHKQDLIGAEEAYSVIRSVLRWETGGPPQ
jgi:hypothetical protein